MIKNPKVLVIEDDKFISKAMKYKFEEANFKTKCVRTAEEGLVILNDWLPSVIILDILLPGIDGYEFLRRVKNDPKYESIPVIVASNLNESEGGTVGATDYIVKSDLDLDKLVKKALKNVKK